MSPSGAPKCVVVLLVVRCPSRHGMWCGTRASCPTTPMLPSTALSSNVTHDNAPASARNVGTNGNARMQRQSECCIGYLLVGMGWGSTAGGIK
eukprot:6488840-Amphidinium_carterae.3